MRRHFSQPSTKSQLGLKISLGAVMMSVVLMIAGCIDTRSAPVDYGAEADPQAILNALNIPTQNLKATNIKVGEFVAMETTQDLALGASFSIVGDTGATITDRTEDTDRVLFKGVLKQLTLQSDGTYSKTARDGEILCASKTVCACGECPASTEQSKAQPFIGVKAEPIAPAIQRTTLLTSQSQGAQSVKNLSYTDPDKLVSLAAAAATAGPTYHRFSTWKTIEQPPANIASQPNCLGIPSCLINIYHVQFDEIYWDTPKGNKVHIEAAVSPDVPYLSRNLSTCQSLLVNVGTDGSNILLKQCSNVFDFRFQSE